MKNQLLGLLIIATLMISCNNKKNYKYVEIVEEIGILGGTETKEKEPKIIQAGSDSAAFLDAFQKFCISLKVNQDMKQAMGTVYSTPVRFKLLNDKEIDISTTTFFADKEKRVQEIEKQIFSLANNLQESVNKNKNEEEENFKKTVKIDSIKVKEYEKYFQIKTDEFSTTNLKWYKPKTAPQYANRNGIYCYFQTENGIPSNLRFRVQYHSEEWLFFSKVQFAIDGKAFDFIPDNTETDSGNGGHIWEWFDQGLVSSDKELIYALSNAKSAKMKFIGKQYYDIKAVSQDQIKSIKRTLDLYNALGGQY